MLVLLLLLLTAPAGAQTGANAALYLPDTSNFPRIEAYLSILDAQGQFIYGLRPEDILLQEDGVSVPTADLTEVRPGIQIVTVLNPGQTFSVRNSKGLSRYDLVVEALTSWVKSRTGSTLDDWSLLITNGPSLSHTANPKDLLIALSSQQIDLRAATPGLDTLSSALDLAADAPPRPGMKRFLLFITAPLPEESLSTLSDLATRASQSEVPIAVWLVTSTGPTQAKDIARLNELATQTGGQFMVYTGVEELPNPEQYLASLRSLYRITYQSRARVNGAHQLSAEVITRFGRISTEPQSFNIDLRPPNPAFISPPLQIDRQHPISETAGILEDLTFAEYLPDRQEINLIVDFPDGKIRPLARTTLYVDSVKVAENTKPPFDRFSWDLRSISDDGSHTIRVEAEDSLGLVGSSIETIVQVNVEQPKINPLRILLVHLPAVLLALLILAGTATLGVLVVRGKLQPRVLSLLKRPPRRPETRQNPPHSEPGPNPLAGWIAQLQKIQRRGTPKALAFLQPLSETPEGLSADDEKTRPIGIVSTAAERAPVETMPYPITADETILGSNPAQATLILDDNTIEACHARLLHQADGGFLITDENTIAGTWVNYTPASKEGIVLEHGDLVHIGRLAFRFTLRLPRLRKAVILPLEEPTSDPG